MLALDVGVMLYHHVLGFVWHSRYCDYENLSTIFSILKMWLKYVFAYQMAKYIRINVC